MIQIDFTVREKLHRPELSSTKNPRANLKTVWIIGAWNLDIALRPAQGGELVEPFVIWCLDFFISK